ncbi:YceI family protein [Massilia cavernae]|nr:YceI family protein [Massilia cavernae]
MKRYLAPLLLLAGCVAPMAPRQPQPPLAADAGAWYAAAAAAGKPVYRLDPGKSLIAVKVYSGGPFAAMGHDHLIAARNLNGFAAPGDGRADFQFRLDEMSIDETALRHGAGMAKAVPREAIEGTRENMLGRVLQSASYPIVKLSAASIPGSAGVVRLSISLHGVTRTVDVPASVTMDRETLNATGRFTLKQTDFGITPMSIFGGGLVVRDAMDLEFRLHARRMR